MTRSAGSDTKQAVLDSAGDETFMNAVFHVTYR